MKWANILNNHCNYIRMNKAFFYQETTDKSCRYLLEKRVIRLAQDMALKDSGVCARWILIGSLSKRGCSLLHVTTKHFTCTPAVNCYLCSRFEKKTNENLRHGMGFNEFIFMNIVLNEVPCFWHMITCLKTIQIYIYQLKLHGKWKLAKIST